MATETPKLPLTVRKNLKDGEPMLQKQLERIQKALGHTYTFEAPDYAAMHPVFVKAQREMGEVIYGHNSDSYLCRLANKIEHLAKDEMTKEGLVEATSARKITFELSTSAKGYVECIIKNGMITISVHPDNLWRNVAETGNDIMAQL